MLKFLNIKGGIVYLQSTKRKRTNIIAELKIRYTKIILFVLETITALLTSLEEECFYNRYKLYL